MTPRKKPEDLLKRGVKPIFTDELIEKVLEKIYHGQTERSIFREEGMPDWTTWCKYKREHPSFINRYAHAKEDGFLCWEDDLVKISDDTSRDILEDEVITEGDDGEMKHRVTRKSDNTAVNRDKLRSDNRKWLMSVGMPHKYGVTKQQIELAGKDGAPLVPVLNINLKK